MKTEYIEDCLEDDCLKPIKYWLYQNKSNFNAEKRYYGGRLFSLKNDLDTLMDSNMGSRAAASSRLANYTGEVLPFNPNGFVTHMKQSQRKWIEWFDENQDRFPDGNWYLDGNKV